MISWALPVKDERGREKNPRSSSEAEERELDAVLTPFSPVQPNPHEQTYEPQYAKALWACSRNRG